MKRTLLFLRTTAIILVSGIFLLTSCQKEQVVTPGQQSAETVQSGTAQTVDQLPAMKADMSFDSAARHIMQHFMQKVSTMKMTCDPDIDFAKMMILHHNAGIQMANAEMMYGHDPKAKALAKKSKEANKESKQRLEAYLATNPTPHPLAESQCMLFMKQMDKSMQIMMMGMNKASEIENVDVDFSGQMIAHHTGAIGMSDVELKWGRDHATLSEARKLIKEQAKEIVEFGRYIKQKIAASQQ